MTKRSEASGLRVLLLFFGSALVTWLLITALPWRLALAAWMVSGWIIGTMEEDRLDRPEED